MGHEESSTFRFEFFHHTIQDRAILIEKEVPVSCVPLTAPSVAQ